MTRLGPKEQPHTPEPWYVVGEPWDRTACSVVGGPKKVPGGIAGDPHIYDHVATAGPELCLDCEDDKHSPEVHRADARRIVGAVNACKGIRQDALEADAVGKLREAARRLVVAYRTAPPKDAPEDRLREWARYFADAAEEAALVLDQMKGRAAVEPPPEQLRITGYDGVPP